MKKSFLILVITALCINADIINFTDLWYKTKVNGKTSTGWFETLEIPDLLINITSKNGKLIWANERSIPGYAGDGIGVNDDEITGSAQEVKVEFNKSVQLSGIELLDLFYEKDNKLQTGIVDKGYFEVGYYSIDDGTKNTFYALNQRTDLISSQSVSPAKFGQLLIDVPDYLVIDYITFGSYDQLSGLGGNNDYAIAKLDVSVAVPEPQIISLLGLGMLGIVGMVGIRRKRR